MFNNTDEKTIVGSRSANPLPAAVPAPIPGTMLNEMGYPVYGMIPNKTPERDRPFNPCTGGSNVY